MPDVEVILQGYHLGSDQGRFGLAGVYLVRGSRNILVDTAHIGRREKLLKELDRVGLGASDIDVIVLTHAHWDHMLNIDLFPEAQVLLGGAELSYLRSPHPADWATPPWLVRVLAGAQTDIATDGLELGDGVEIVATPGHTWGSVSVSVRRGDTMLAIVGDALPNARSAVLGAPYNVFADDGDARRSASRLIAGFSEFYPGHDRPFRLVDGTVTYLAESHLNVHGSLDPGQSDISVTISAMQPPQTYRLIPAASPMVQK